MRVYLDRLDKIIIGIVCVMIAFCILAGLSYFIKVDTEDGEVLFTDTFQNQWLDEKVAGGINNAVDSFDSAYNYWLSSSGPPVKSLQFTYWMLSS